MSSTRILRIYLAAVGIFAVWVGAWGYLLPDLVDKALPWTVPPLHARFIGSMYLSGALLMFGTLFSARGEAFVPVVMAAVWTGVLGIVSFLHLDQFEFWRSTVWFWFFAYVAYPLAGAWLAWSIRGEAAAAGPPPPGWIRILSTIQAIACIVLAAALFVAADFMTTLWPWKITPLLAQLYAGPFLSYGVGAMLVARSPSLRAARWPLLSMATFAVLVLAASSIHFALFQPLGLAAFVWFGGLFGFGGYLLLAGLRAVRAT